MKVKIFQFSHPAKVEAEINEFLSDGVTVDRVIQTSCAAQVVVYTAGSPEMLPGVVTTLTIFYKD